MNPNVLKYLGMIGAVDGAVYAAAVTLGQQWPAWAPYTTPVVQVCGVITSILGVVVHMQVRAALKRP
jgi:hypothetical protein